MHIPHLTINEHIASRLGLQQNTMRDIGSLVVLVGENGCGKTRMLEAVDWLLRRTNHIGYDKLLKLRNNKERQHKVLDAMSRDWDGDHYTHSSAASDLGEYVSLLSPMDNFELAFADKEDTARALESYCALSDLMRNSSNPNRDHFARLAVGVPRGDRLADPLLIGSPLNYIDDICVRQAANTDSNESLGLRSANSGIEASYARLQEFITNLTGMVLGIENGHATLNGLSIARTAFSNGQMVLLRVATLLHSEVLQNTAVPILLDEPEQHLHPSRLIRLVDEIRKQLPDAQLWVATHNLALTAHLAAIEPRAIWFGSHGKFERAGQLPENVVHGLLGGPAGAELISDFCMRSDLFAACSFSADCLCPPEAVAYKSKDEQIEQIHKFIAPDANRRLTVVDFGAGQGRLLDGLVESLGDRLAEFISYYAIEQDPRNKEICTRRVGQYFGDGSVRVFYSASELFESVGANADVIVMANVLHEIPIEHWEVVLHDANSLLIASGSLLIVEDTRLPRGELAHANGFLILEAEALCELFCTNCGDSTVQRIQSRRAGTRLQATVFKKHHLSSVNHFAIERALRAQLKIAACRTRQLRDSKDAPNYALGRNHAYNTQLVANLTLALEDLENIARDPQFDGALQQAKPSSDPLENAKPS
jgi:hypothetical protein